MAKGEQALYLTQDHIVITLFYIPYTHKHHYGIDPSELCGCFLCPQIRQTSCNMCSTAQL